MDRTDAVLIEAIARELERLNEGKSAYTPLAMMAQLLRTIETGPVQLSPAPDRNIDPDRLHDYLVAKGVIKERDRIDVLRSTLGFSKDTYMIEISFDSGETETVVIRRNQPAGSTGTTVLDEFPLLQDCDRLGFPVAIPILVEPDPTVFGQPFMLSRGVRGEPDFADRAALPGDREQAAKDLANFLARLHTLDTGSVRVKRLAEMGSPGEELAAYFGEWRGFWQECAPNDYPDIESFFGVMPDLASMEKVCVVHSHVGFHNILVDESGITAVVDWEFAHLGEPEEDLSYCRDSVEKLVSWETFLRFYMEAGGAAPSEERLAAYGRWRFLRNATCCALGREAFAQGLNNDLRLAFAGRIILEQSILGLRSTGT